MAGKYFFKNDIGVPEIKIGTKGFVCIGAEPPMDHPHIYLTMGDKNFKHCLYCNTKFVYEPALHLHLPCAYQRNPAIQADTFSKICLGATDVRKFPLVWTFFKH